MPAQQLVATIFSEDEILKNLCYHLLSVQNFAFAVCAILEKESLDDEKSG